MAALTLTVVDYLNALNALQERRARVLQDIQPAKAAVREALLYDAIRSSEYAADELELCRTALDRLLDDRATCDAAIEALTFAVDHIQHTKEAP